MGSTAPGLSPLSQQLIQAQAQTAAGPLGLLNEYTALSAITSVAVDPTGLCYFSFGTTVASITPLGVVTIIGTSFSAPKVALNSLGTRLYIANTTGTTVQVYVPATGTLTVLVSGITNPNFPFVDAGGNIWVSSTTSAIVYRFSAFGTPLATIFFSGYSIQGFTVDPSFNVYVSDGSLPSIIKATAPAYALTTGYGGGASPIGGAMVATATNGLYFQSGNSINYIPPAGTTNSTIYTDTPSSILYPEAIDASGNLYVSNYRATGTVIKITASPAFTATTYITGASWPQVFGISSNGVSYLVNLNGQTQLNYYGPSPTGGVATFTFPSVPQGYTWTGTLSCATANTGTVFYATVGSTPWGEWGGNSVFGPVQAQSMQQLVVTATGLTLGSVYTLNWVGSSDPAGTVGAIWPDSNSTALTAQISGTVPISGSVTTTGSVTTLPGSQTNAAGFDILVASYGFTSLPSTSPSYTAAQSYAGFQIGFQSTGLTPTSVYVTNVTQGFTYVINRPGSGQGSFPTGYFINSSGFNYLVPLQANAGDLIQIVINGSGSSVVGGTLQLVGLKYSAVAAVTPSPNQSFDVVNFGGASAVNVSVASTSNSSILAAPPAGYAYRLHSFAGPYNAALTVGGSLRDAAGNVYAALAPQSPFANMGGSICKVQLYANNFGAAAQVFSLIYDTVVLPNIL